MYEQFIRQSIASPSKPIIVFSASETPNWEQQACKNINSNDLPELSDLDKSLVEHLDKDPVKIVSDLNKSLVQRWSAFSELVTVYKTAGIQLWNHDYYESYKCKGKY